MGNLSPKPTTEGPVDGHVTRRTTSRRYTTNLITKDDHTSQVLSTPAATTQRHTTAFTSPEDTVAKKTTNQRGIFTTSSTKGNDGFNDKTVVNSSGTILQKPTPAQVATIGADRVVLVTCLAGTILFLFLAIAAVIILRGRRRGKISFRNGGIKGALHANMTSCRPVSESKSAVLQMTSDFDGQEYTSIDEDSAKMHPTQTENLYDSVKVNIPQSAQDVIYYEAACSGCGSESLNAEHRQIDNKGALYPKDTDDGIYLTPDVHEKKQEQTDPGNRYSTIWPKEES